MLKRLLFIESNTTGTGMLALRKAIDLGMQPTFFTNMPERYIGLEEIGCPVVVCDTNILEALKRAIEEHIPHAGIRGILTTSEFYLETVAELTTFYQLPGNPPDAIRKARNKSQTRRALGEADIYQPVFAAVDTIKEALKAIKDVGLPCVVKPIDDSSSNNVLCCQTHEQVEKHAAKLLAVTTNVRGQRTGGAVLIEQYLEAPEFSVETFTRQGETTFIGITQKWLTGFPYFVEERHIFPAALSVTQEELIYETVHRAISAIGIQNGATHTEVKWTSAGCAIIEINARLAGGMIPGLVQRVTGVDMLEQQIHSAIGNSPSLHMKQHGVAGIQFVMAEKAGTLLNISGIEEAVNVSGVELVKITAKLGRAVQPPQNAYHRLGYVIVHCQTAKEAVASLQMAISRIRLQIDE